MKTRYLAAVIAVFGVCGPAIGEDSGPPPFQEFTFKRVKPPTAGTSKRITVQITPKSEVSADVWEPTAPSAPREADYPWFWEATSAQADAANAGRLFEVTDLLAANPGVPTPRLQDLQRIAAENNVNLLRASVGTRVSPAFALAVISVESGGRTDAVSSAGAQGLMQLMPDTAEELGVAYALDAQQNIDGGVRLLDKLMAAYGDDPILVLAAYNAGQGAVRDHGGVPPFVETRNYVPRVMAAWTVARALCKTPPILLSDGCVFELPEGT